jgi:DNA (cytosine-5)-methyltransferase 1
MNAHVGALFASTLLAATPALNAHGLPYIIDSFAGGGGASTGIEQALGRSPDYAINHNAAALALHAANHPATIHLSENVYKVDPLDHLRGKHIGLAWFSPDCKHFSKAKGGKPVERNIRDLCWIIPGWIERIQKSGGKVDVVMMENVEEFKDYGPLIETPRGLMPDPKRKGQEYRRWCKAIRKLGGKMESRELRGYEFGAATIRKRLFIVIRFDGQPIVWPTPTHGCPDDPDVIAGRKLPWRIVGDCIDYSLPCPSIFDSAVEIKEKHGLVAKRPLAYNSMARVARGFDRFVLKAKRPYLVQLGYGERLGQAPRCMSVDQPLGTVVAGSIKHAVVAPVLTYAQQGGASRSVEKPAHTVTASSKDQNGVFCAYMAQHNSDSRRIGGVNPGRSANAPLSAITQTGSHQQLVSAYVARDFGTSTGHGMDQPCGTVMPEGQGKTRLITPYMQAYYGTGEGAAYDTPMRTATCNDRHAHVEATLDVPPFTEAQAARARQVADFLRSFGLWDEREFVTLEIDGVTFVVVDIGMRMLTPRELYTAQGFPTDYQIDGYYDRSQIGHNGGPVWVPFSKDVQVSCVGNSVCPPVARALAAANCGHLAVQAVAA